MKRFTINKNLDIANMSQTAADVWRSGPTVDIVPLLVQPPSNDPASWIKPPGVKSQAQVAVDQAEINGASAFSFACHFPNGGGYLPVWGFGCLYQGNSLGVIPLDQPIWLARNFVLNVRGQAQPVR